MPEASEFAYSVVAGATVAIIAILGTIVWYLLKTMLGGHVSRLNHVEAAVEETKQTVAGKVDRTEVQGMLNSLRQQLSGMQVSVREDLIRYQDQMLDTLKAIETKLDARNDQLNKRIDDSLHIILKRHTEGRKA